MIINEASLWKWLSLKLTERTGQTELADESTSCQLTVYLCFFFTLLMETTVWVQSTVCHGELFSLIFQLMVIYFWWMFKSFLLFWTLKWLNQITADIWLVCWLNQTAAVLTDGFLGKKKRNINPIELYGWVYRRECYVSPSSSEKRP